MDSNKFKMLEFFVINYWDVDILKGEIRSKKYKNRILGSECLGYIQIGSSFEGKRYTYYAHQIVAFVGGLDVLNFEINHIDGNKKNNSIYNLEAVTRKENMRHLFESGFHNSLKGISNNSYGLSFSEIERIKEEIEKLKEVQKKSYKNLLLELSSQYNVPLHLVERIGKARK